jgi:xanthine dehydrogenase accessory factor|tara:strand:+ start:4020 stop:5075 length:1056 start_codon:yes stop_codon:yes gene_type:complete
MHALWPQIETWIDNGRRFALATVVATEGSSPREVGSVMAIDPVGPHFIGSVSSGCLEVEVIEAANEVIELGRVRYFHFGPENTVLWDDGLTCGGRVKVRLEPWMGLAQRGLYEPVVNALRNWIQNDRSGVILSSDLEHIAITATDVVGPAGSWSNAIMEDAYTLLSEAMPSREIEVDEKNVFARSILPRPRLFIVGAVEVAIKLVELAKIARWKTLVADPREAYTQASRFEQMPDELIEGWPETVIDGLNLGPRDAAIVLTHDPKIDDAALIELLDTRVGYIGAMGSRKSHESRRDRLRDAGISDERLERIDGPCGLHLGSANAVGIATGILAGILQWQARDSASDAEPPL